MEFCDFGTLENLRKMEVGCFSALTLAPPYSHLQIWYAGRLHNGPPTHKNNISWRHTGAALFALKENDPPGSVADDVAVAFLRICL